MYVDTDRLFHDLFPFVVGNVFGIEFSLCDRLLAQIWSPECVDRTLPEVGTPNVCRSLLLFENIGFWMGGLLSQTVNTRRTANTQVSGKHTKLARFANLKHQYNKFYSTDMWTWKFTKFVIQTCNIRVSNLWNLKHWSWHRVWQSSVTVNSRFFKLETILRIWKIDFALTFLKVHLYTLMNNGIKHCEIFAIHYRYSYILKSTVCLYTLLNVTTLANQCKESRKLPTTVHQSIWRSFGPT